jgi:SH3 domain protein
MEYRYIIFLPVLLLSLFSVPAQAETDFVYINDVLRVGVRPEPDSRVTPIGVVVTGMKLEVLDRRENYVQIRTDKGLTGWIKGIYVTQEPPAVIQLKQLKDGQKDANEKLDELQQNLKVLQEANNTLNEQVDQLKSERSELQMRLAQNTSGQQQNHHFWIWWLIGLCGVAVAAFTGGIAWHRQETSRRLGGLRL